MKQILILILLLCSVAIFAQLPTNGLIAYYPFNGNAHDESPNKNNATVEGATLTTDRNGNSNTAYYFNGQNNYIQTPLTPSFSNTMTLCGWFKSNTMTNFSSILLSRDNAGTLSGIATSGHGVAFHYNAKNVDAVCTPYDGNWHFALATYDGNTMKIYYDNVLKSSNIEVATIQSRDFYKIGVDDLQCQGCGNRFFNGVIDDIRIYNRALSESEIQALYKETPEEARIAGQKRQEEMRIEKEKEGILIAKRNAQIQTNSNKALWKLGNKICTEQNGGTYQATIDQWNEDKSQVKIVVISGPSNIFEGQKAEKGSSMWVSPNVWHLCLDDEMQKSLSNDKSLPAPIYIPSTPSPSSTPSSSYSSSCSSCGGHGRCTSCAGKGQKVCYDCSGDGKNHSWFSGSSSDNCSRCKGRGSEKCYDCSGSGSCRSCGGRGK